MEDASEMDIDRPAPGTHDPWHMLLPVLVSAWRDTLPWTSGLRAPMVLTCKKFHHLWPMYNVQVSPCATIHKYGYTTLAPGGVEVTNSGATLGEASGSGSAAGPSSSRGYAHLNTGDASTSEGVMLIQQMLPTSTTNVSTLGHASSSEANRLFLAADGREVIASLGQGAIQQPAPPLERYAVMMSNKPDAFDNVQLEEDAHIFHGSGSLQTVASTSGSSSFTDARHVTLVPRVVQPATPLQSHASHLHVMERVRERMLEAQESLASDASERDLYRILKTHSSELKAQNIAQLDESDTLLFHDQLVSSRTVETDKHAYQKQAVISQLTGANDVSDHALESAAYAVLQLGTSSVAGSGSQPESPGFHTSASAAGSDSTFFSATSHSGSIFGSQQDSGSFPPSTSNSLFLSNPPYPFSKSTSLRSSNTFNANLAPITPSPHSFNHLFTKQNSIRDLVVNQVPCSGSTLQGLTQLRQLTILESSISQPWHSLQAMPHLRRLKISKCRSSVGDASLLQCLAALSRLAHLHLDLSLMRVNEATFQHVVALKKLPYLEHVHLGFGATFSPHYLRQLAGWAPFKSLETRFLDMQPSHISSLAQLSQLTRLDLLVELSDTITYDTLEVLSNLSELKVLSWYWCPTEGLDVLNLLPRLEVLHLSGLFRLMQPTLERIASIPGLKHLTLQDIVVMDTDEEITDTWTQLTMLQSLDLGHKEHTQLSMPHLPQLAHLSDLTALRLNGCFSLDEAAMQLLASATTVRILDVSWCPNIPPAGFAHLSRLQNLLHLNAEGCSGINAEALMGLKTIKGLKELWVAECGRITIDNLLLTLLLLEGMRELELLDLRGTKVLEQLGTRLGAIGNMILHPATGTFRSLTYSPLELPWNVNDA